MVWRTFDEALGNVLEQAAGEMKKRESKLRELIDTNIWSTTPLGQVGVHVGDTGAA